MGSNWKLIVVFAILFLIGAVAGFWLAPCRFEHKWAPLNPTRNVHSWTNHLVEKLNRIAKLTPDQAEKIRPRVEAAVRQMQSIRAQSMQQGSDVFDTTIADIERSLDPDQQRRLEKFRIDRRADLQKAIDKQREGATP
jgi:hypothetical protein